MLENYKDHVSNDKAELEATRLIQYFQCYSIKVGNLTRQQYAKFSALQHINLIVNPKMEIEELVFWMEVATQINKRK
jgi:hypothetical protein